FTAEDFARSHPGGSLGRKLLTRVKDIMRTGEALPKVSEEAMLTLALTEMTQKGLGFTAVVNHQNQVTGIFTDGDLRRAFASNISASTTQIHEVMRQSPKTIHPEQMAVEAVELMEHYKINGLMVVNDQNQLVGAFNMHDLLKAKVV
ncbi:MAG TPA: D-arabinose 5-phosphate isomerase, partial [Methylophilaceae bacterium]|nr:D-arabinose 5-phosphate isomerase [Methylophilaceae bacterium]